MKPGYIYILTNKNNTTLYVGVTAYLKIRIMQHKEKKDPKSFTARYNIDKLVYYEGASNDRRRHSKRKAIKRRKQSTKNKINRKYKSRLG